MIAFPHHDSAAFLEVVQIGGYWFVRQTCPCHKGRKVSVPFPTRARAESCRRALDEVSAQLVANPLPAPSGRLTWTPARCVRGDLRKRRRKLGLTGADLAQQLSVHRSTISIAERRGKSTEMVRRLAAALSDAERTASSPQHSA